MLLLDFYRRLNYSVEKTSILQLGQKSSLSGFMLDFQCPDGHVFAMGIIAFQSSWKRAEPQ